MIGGWELLAGHRGRPPVVQGAVEPRVPLASSTETGMGVTLQKWLPGGLTVDETQQTERIRVL